MTICCVLGYMPHTPCTSMRNPSTVVLKELAVEYCHHCLPPSFVLGMKQRDSPAHKMQMLFSHPQTTQALCYSWEVSETFLAQSLNRGVES